MAHDRLVAGLWCSEVLALLSDYLDRELGSDRVGQVERHLAACDWCARFGGEMSAVVQALRERVGPAEPVDAAVAERLLRRLEDEPESS